MQFTYTVFTKQSLDSESPRTDIRRHVSTNFDEFCEDDVTNRSYIEVYNNSTQTIERFLKNTDDYEVWRLKLEREYAWKPRSFLKNSNQGSSDKYNSAVNPAHYKSYLDDYEWLDVQARIPRFKDKSNFKAAIELQIRKYLDRNGRKDDELQEMQKGLFYHIYLVLYSKADKPIKVSDVHKIMDLIHETSIRYRD